MLDCRTLCVMRVCGETTQGLSTENEADKNTMVSSCLSKKNLVYVETSNVLQLDNSLSLERVKAKFKKKEKENDTHPTAPRIASSCTTYAGVIDRKQRNPGEQLTGEIDIGVQYIYIKYKI